MCQNRSLASDKCLGQTALGLQNDDVRSCGIERGKIALKARVTFAEIRLSLLKLLRGLTGATRGALLLHGNIFTEV